MYKINDFEIMAPVGSRESLAAAIQAGADSIYFGIENLNMRARSAVSTPSSLTRAVVSDRKRYSSIKNGTNIPSNKQMRYSASTRSKMSSVKVNDNSP